MTTYLNVTRLKTIYIGCRSCFVLFCVLYLVRLLVIMKGGSEMVYFECVKIAPGVV